MKCLLTGATGFIGSHLVEALLGHDHDVVIIDINTAFPLTHPRLRIIKTDITSMDQVSHAFKEVQPDMIFHLAAQSFPKVAWEKPQATMTINLNGSINILEAMRSLGKPVRLVAAGSSAEYAPNQNGFPIKETDLCKPPNLYGVSKLAMTETIRLYVERYDLDAIVMRPFFIIGPRKTGDFCSDVAKSIVEIERVMREKLDVGNLKVARDFLDVRDAIGAMLVLMEKGQKGETYNIASGTGYVLEEILKIYKKMARVRIEEKLNPAFLRPNDEMIKVGDPSKLKTLGWQPHYLIEESLEAILEYWRNIPL
jgi:GDP-4-dehydro-6-deoxy-D-mannose reductase